MALQDQPDIRPVIARMLAVEAWRATYLDHLRELARTELDWNKLGGRVQTYRELISEDLGNDPFFGDLRQFNSSLEGNGQSLESLSGQRRKFLIEHPLLKVEADS